MIRTLALLGGTILLLAANSAFADALVMQCDKTACMRLRCDDWRENCSLAGYFRHANGTFAVPHSRQVCDEFGDCHFALPSYPPSGNAQSPGDATSKAQ
ncbi:MAG: hypothetical protein ABSA49_14755 [Rhizomicrobium sp.]